MADRFGKQREFYDALGRDGLQGLGAASYKSAQTACVAAWLKKDGEALDLACGYGRVTLPLIEKGFDVVGLDLSPALIRQARRAAKEAGLKAEFDVGNMCKLPYPDGRFKYVFCMWSSFNHLTRVTDQAKCLGEVFRVLARGGSALFDLTHPRLLEKIGTKRFGKDARYYYGVNYKAMRNRMYLHDETSLKDLAQYCGIAKISVRSAKLGEYDRLLCRIRKP